MLAPAQRFVPLQSALSNTDNFGTGTQGPFQRDVRLIECQIKGVKKDRDKLYGSVLERFPSYRESNKESKEWQGPTLGVRFVRLIESQIKGVKKDRKNSKGPSQRDFRLIESQIKGVKKSRDQLQVSVLQRCPLRENRLVKVKPFPSSRSSFIRFQSQIMRARI